MSTINLLPEDLRPMRGQRWRQAMRVALPLATVSVVVTWAVMARAQINDLDAKIADAEARQEEMVVLIRERDRLSTRAAQAAPIREPMPALAVVALLTQLIPEEVTVNELAIDVPPAAAPTAGAAQKSAHRAASLPGIVVTLIGRAPQGTAVAQCLIDLQRCGVFEDVQIRDSSEVPLGDRMVQEFRLSMQVPLWRPAPVVKLGVAAP